MTVREARLATLAKMRERRMAHVDALATLLEAALLDKIA